MTCELAPDPPEPLKPRPNKVAPDPYPEGLNDPKWTFGNLPEWQTLAIHCKSCDRVAPVDSGRCHEGMASTPLSLACYRSWFCECEVKGNSEWKMGWLPR